MQKNQSNPPAAHQVAVVVKHIIHMNHIHMKELLIKYKKPIVITSAVIILQLLYGFDPKFLIINLIWLLV